MTDYKGKRILIIDGYGRQIPSILKQFHEMGLHITTINDSKLDVGYTSRYPNKKIVIPGIRNDYHLLKQVIDKEAFSDDYDIIFPVIEKSTDIVSKYVEEGKLSDKKILCAPRQAFLLAYDKQETMRICMENGIPCPITKMADETLESFLSKVKFPLACKPRKGSGGVGFKKVNSLAELQKYIADGTIRVEDYVIQEYIPQTEHMNNCYVMLDDAHNPVYSVAIETCRWYPVDGGPGCFGRTIDKPSINENAIKLLQAMKWSGFGQVSFMVDPRDGQAKVSEINGRISAGIKMMDLVGCTPMKFLLDKAYGAEMKPVSHKIPAGQGLRYFHTDLLWFLKSPDRFRADPSWFDFRHSKDYIFSLKDPIPFFSYAIEHLLTYKTEMEKRKHE